MSLGQPSLVAWLLCLYIASKNRTVITIRDSAGPWFRSKRFKRPVRIAPYGIKSGIGMRAFVDCSSHLSRMLYSLHRVRNALKAGTLLELHHEGNHEAREYASYYSYASGFLQGKALERHFVGVLNRDTDTLNRLLLKFNRLLYKQFRIMNEEPDIDYSGSDSGGSHDGGESSVSRMTSWSRELLYQGANYESDISSWSDSFDEEERFY